MSIKQQTPQIRFTGFSEDWIEKKLADVLKIKSGLSQKEIEVADGIYPILATGGEIGRTNTALYNKESVLIGRKGTIDKPYYMNTPFWTVDTLFYSELSEHVSGLFVFTLFQKIQWRKLDTSTGVPSLTSSTIHNIIANFPTKDEQAAIGNLFQNIDQTIALQRRKHEQTQTLKKSLLSKMFPKKGQKQPEIRLAGFSGDWVETKLGDKGYCKSGIGFAINEQNGKVGIPFYKVSDMNLTGNEIIMNKARSYVTNDQVSHNKWSVFTELPSIIFAKVGAAVMLNRKRLILKEYLSDNNMMSYILGEEWDCYFCKLIFENIYLPNLSQVGALPSINARDVEGLMILIPDLKKEQTAIGQFFKQLDDTISLQAKQLKTLENLKQALLAKMFV